METRGVGFQRCDWESKVEKNGRPGFSDSCRTEWMGRNKAQEGFTHRSESCWLSAHKMVPRDACGVHHQRGLVHISEMEIRPRQELAVCYQKQWRERPVHIHLCKSSMIIVPEWWQEMYQSQDTAEGAKGILLQVEQRQPDKRVDLVLQVQCGTILRVC
jgi:hypothetical protein